MSQQYCNAVLREKSSLRITVSCNITFVIRRLSQYSCQRFLKVCTSQMTLILVPNCKTGKLDFVFTRVLILISSM